VCVCVCVCVCIIDVRGCVLFVGGNDDDESTREREN
jgi:hypothetical protein